MSSRYDCRGQQTGVNKAIKVFLFNRETLYKLIFSKYKVVCLYGAVSVMRDKCEER